MTDAQPLENNPPAEGEVAPATPESAPGEGSPSVATSEGVDGMAEPNAPAEAPAESVAAEPEAPVDNRELWYCVEPYGPRTPHEPFRSDAHLDAAGFVECPTCGSRSVMRASQWDANNPPIQSRV